MNRDFENWTPQSAFQERIEREAWRDWAVKETSEFSHIPPLPYQGWNPTPLHAFISKILP